jgi:hypothetical protein
VSLGVLLCVVGVPGEDVQIGRVTFNAFALPLSSPGFTEILLYRTPGLKILHLPLKSLYLVIFPILFLTVPAAVVDGLAFSATKVVSWRDLVAQIAGKSHVSFPSLLNCLYQSQLLQEV